MNFQHKLHSLSSTLPLSLYIATEIMKRNSNLELELPLVRRRLTFMVDESEINGSKQLTIFYNGRVVVCDATELQARAIIWVASREVDEKSNGSGGSDPVSPLTWASVLYGPTAGLTGSLKRFLQTRKTRVQATSPCPVATRSD